jgi:hypothetical protein
MLSVKGLQEYVFHGQVFAEVPRDMTRDSINPGKNYLSTAVLKSGNLIPIRKLSRVSFNPFVKSYCLITHSFCVSMVHSIFKT